MEHERERERKKSAREKIYKNFELIFVWFCENDFVLFVVKEKFYQKPKKI